MTDRELENIIVEKTGEPLRFCQGWFSLVKKLYKELIDAGWDGNVTCVKEKYGHIEFYISSYNEMFEAIIEKYKSISVSTCETCGNPGRPMQDFNPVCATHYLDWSYDFQQQFVNYRNLGTCLICGYYAVEENECKNCHFPQWNEVQHTHWEKDEFIKAYQLEWYSFIKDIEDRLVSPLEKVINHRVLVTEEEIKSHEYSSEFDV